MSDSFFSFSCAVYTQAKDIFLRLQDEGGLDINVLLFCCWLGGNHYPMGNMPQVIAIAKDWDSYIVPLRDIRRRMKSVDEDLYLATKKLELQYEFACQQALEKYAVAHVITNKEDGGGGAIHDNLQCYLQFHSAGKIASWIDEAIYAISDIAKDYKET